MRPLRLSKNSGGAIARNARIATANYYKRIGREFDGGHESVNHSRHEYARGPIHTNTIEGFFGLLKRGVNGTFHHISPKHLHRYLSEFEFRYNTRGMDDGERTGRIIRAAQGKRLTYKQQLGKE